MDEPAAADVVRCCCSMEELWTVAEKNLNLCIEMIWGVQVSTLAKRIV